MLRIGILGCGNIAGTLAGTMVRMPDVLRIATRHMALTKNYMRIRMWILYI